MNKLFILISTIILAGGLSSCSFLPKVTFNRTTSALPQKTEKSEKRITCKGDITYDKLGRVEKCTEGYTINEKYYNQAERKFTFFEHIGNFFSNLKGWFGILIIISIVVALMGGGGLVATIWSNIFGTGIKLVKALGRGIQNGKEYVRSNGTKYTESERVIYNQGADDLLAQIDEAIDDKEIEKLLYKIRAEIKWEK